MTTASLANLRPPWTKEEASAAARKGNMSPTRHRSPDAADYSIARPSGEVSPAARRIEKQLRKIEGMMDKTKDAGDLSSLSAAHARLFTAWQVLTGTPNPGSRRSKQGRPQAPTAAPMEVINPPQNPLAT